MTQTRTDSFMEALTNVAIGFGINFVANILVLPAVLGVPVNLTELGLIGVIFTVISVTRSYTLRRLFNGRSVWQAIKDRFFSSPARQMPIGGVERNKNTTRLEGRLLKGN